MPIHRLRQRVTFSPHYGGHLVMPGLAPVTVGGSVHGDR
jgi:hypothetical protein